ncbi:hypothetical protein [Nostoc sp. DedQUE04]|nr:hypothetical protein [Nostoc sp. DedQUE04]
MRIANSQLRIGLTQAEIIALLMGKRSLSPLLGVALWLTPVY